MGIHLGAAILEHASEMNERLIHRRGISSGDGARRGDQRFALPGGVLMEDENGKDVAEEKPGRDQSDATENVQAARARRLAGSRETGHDTGTVRGWSGNRCD